MRYNSDYLITGITAEVLEEFKKNYSFDYIDSYILAGTLGFINSLKASKPERGDKIITIPRTVLLRRKDKLDFLFQLFSLIELADLEQNELMRIVFGDDEVSIEKRLLIFEEYFFGGLEILKDLLKRNSFSSEIDKIWESIESLT